MIATTIRGRGVAAGARDLAAIIAIACFSCNVHGAPPTQESTTLNEQVQPVDSALEAIRTGLGNLVGPDSMTMKTTEAEIPERLFFVEGQPGTAAEESPILIRVRTIARNYGLALEYQSTRLADGAPLFGFLLFEPFETLSLHWTIHPFENVDDAGGRWRQPVADLCDVESVQVHGETVDLVLTEGAAHRLDRLSSVHGHRELVMNVSGLANPSRTWIPGLRTFPRVEAAAIRAASRLRDDAPDLIPERVRSHGAARACLLEELGLPDGVSWGVIERAPLYTQPVYLQLLWTPELNTVPTPFPPLGDDSLTASWPELSKPWTVVPRNWLWKVLTSGGGFVGPDSQAEFDAQDLQFLQLLEENVGRRVALVVNGRVAGIVAVTSPRLEGLKFEEMPRTSVEAVATSWRSMGGSVEFETPASAKAESGDEPSPDTFQVRLMAEPQDREYVAVTHFEAPGATRGIQVAVRKEIILDGRAVTGASIEADGLTLHLTFTPEAQDALGGACFSNMGKQLAILYKNRLLCAPTIDEWEIEDLSFKGVDSDWPEVAKDLAEHLSKG